MQIVSKRENLHVSMKSQILFYVQNEKNKRTLFTQCIIIIETPSREITLTQQQLPPSSKGLPYKKVPVLFVFFFVVVVFFCFCFFVVIFVVVVFFKH